MYMLNEHDYNLIQNFHFTNGHKILLDKIKMFNEDAYNDFKCHFNKNIVDVVLDGIKCSDFLDFLVKKNGFEIEINMEKDSYEDSLTLDHFHVVKYFELKLSHHPTARYFVDYFPDYTTTLNAAIYISLKMIKIYP